MSYVDIEVHKINSWLFKYYKSENKCMWMQKIKYN